MFSPAEFYGTMDPDDDKEPNWFTPPWRMPLPPSSVGKTSRLLKILGNQSQKRLRCAGGLAVCTSSTTDMMPTRIDRKAHRREMPELDLTHSLVLPAEGANVSFQLEVLLCWSGRKFPMSVHYSDRTCDFRVKALEEAGLRGDLGCQDSLYRIVFRGRELPDDGTRCWGYFRAGCTVLILGPRVYG